MATKIFDYNSVPVDPTVYSPKNSKKTDSVDSWFEGGTPVADSPDYKRSIYDDDLVYSNEHIDPSAMRAYNQGGLNKIVTSIAKGAITGTLGAAEYAGYLTDVEEWLGGDTDEVDASYTNWLSEGAKSLKEDVDSSIPVYMRDPNSLWDNGDIAGSVAKALGSTVDSAVSFGLLGLAVAATGGYALGAFGTTAMGAGLLRVSTALAMNYVESKQMASQAISDTKTLLDEKLKTGEINEIDYYKGLEEASVQANEFIWKNKLNTWQDFIALRGLKNITAGPRALAKEATKPLNALLDMGGESFEEVSSGFLQNEVGYKARKAAGIKDPSESTSAIDRAFNYATSEQGIYEGILGAIGGPIQSYAFNKPIEKFVTKKSYQDKLKRQKDQEEFYGRNKESILATAAKQKATSDKLNQALESGDLDAAAEYHAETFADLAFNNFKMGTTEKLEEHLDEVIKDETVDPKLKKFVEQYKKDLPTYEKEYVKIVNRRNEEAAAKKVGDMEQLVHHANIASEFKLFILKNHNNNQIDSLNKEIAKIDSEIGQKGFLENESILSDYQRALVSKEFEIKTLKGTLRENKNLTNTQRTALANQIDSLVSQTKELRKVTKASGLDSSQISAKVQNLLDDKHDLVKKRVEFETANISFDNQIKDVRDNKFTPDIIASIRLTNLAAANLKAGKNTISTNDEVKKAGETAVENMDPESFEVDKALEAQKAEEQRLKDIKTYTDTIIARAKEISADTKLTPKQKVNKLGALTSSVEQNYDLNPTENDKQALNLQGYILKHTEEQVNLLNESEKKDYIKESKKPKPVAEATKNALIKTPKFFTNSNIPTSNKFTQFELIKPEELSELLKNTPIEVINSNVKLVIERREVKPDNNPGDLKNGYYTAINQIRNVIAIVYDDKVLGYIYEPNKFFTLDSKTNKTIPVNFETLPESEIRKLYPNGDIQALRDSWKEAQDLQKFISTKSTSETQVLSNEELQKIGFKVNSFFGEYDLYNSITEWGDLSTVSEALVTLADGKQTHIIYDSYQQAMMSNYPSQVTELLNSLGDKKTPSKKLIIDRTLKDSNLPTGKSRYAILLQLGNGTYEWVALAPKPADTAEVFKTIYNAVKVSLQTKTKIDYNNNPFRNLFIFTEGGLTDVSLRFAENGVIFTFENRVGEGSKEVRIRDNEFDKIKSFEDLVALVNKRIGNELPNNEYIPKTSDGNVLQLQISDFRKSVIVGKEAGNVSETTDLSKDFNISVKPTIFKPVQNLNISSNVRTAEDIVNEDPSSYNPDDPFRQAIAEPDFDNAPEGAEVFTDEGESTVTNKVSDITGPGRSVGVENKKGIIVGRIAGQGTSIELEIKGKTGKEFLLVIDRNGRGNIELYSEKKEFPDGPRYSQGEGRSASPEQIKKLYDEYVPKNIQVAINNWLNSFTGSWAAPETEDGKNYEKVEKTLNTELAALEKEEQPKEEPASKPLTVKEKLAARQAAKAAKTAKGRNNDVDGPMKVGTSLNYNYDYDAAQTWLEDRLPSTISVQDLHSVLEKLKVNGIPMGMLMNNIVYLSQSAERGTEYHEAFHAAFRLLSTESEITNILNQAKKEFKAPTKEELSKLKSQAAQNAFLSEGDLLDLYYEEKLADKFQDITLNKKPASWLGNLYNKIKAWLRFYTNNMDTIEATFYKLDRGLYKNSTIKANRYNNLENFGVLKLLTKGVNEESNIRKTASSELSNKIIYTAAAWIGNQIQSDNGLKSFDENFERFLNMMSSKYDWNNEEQANYYIGLMEDMEEESQKEAFLEKIDEYYILYTDEANRAIIKEQAEALLKTFKVDSTEENEKEKLAEDISERFDVDFFTLGGFDSMTAPVKEFIGLTLYETTDEFGNKMQSGVDFIKVYNGLTATLAGAEDSEMIPRMMLFKKHNTQTEAVIQKFIEATGLQLSEDGKSHTYDADKSNEYHLLLNAFKKEKVSFFTILHDAGKRENSKAATRIIESNRKSSKQLQASNWASNFGSSFVRSKNDPEFKDSLINALNDAMTVFEVSKPLSEADLQKLAVDLKSHLSKVGITISQGYAEYSIASYQVNNYPTYATDVVRSIYEPFANTIPQDLIVSQTHLFEMKSALLRGENIYSKEVTKEDLKTKKKVKSVGTFTRILKMSEGNTFFDENVIESTFTNAENQKVYNYLLRNQLMTKAKDFRDAGKRNALSNGGFINNLNHLLNFKHSSAIFSNYNVSLIDGIKPSVIDNVEDADSIKTMEGTTFGSMDDVQYLQTVLSFFGDQKEIKYGTDGEVVKTAKYVFRQLEASNTGAIVDLPVFEYYVINKEGKLQVTPLFKEHLGNYIQQEWDRIGREFANSTNESRDIYTGYNDKLDGRAFKFWAFPQLNGKYEELAKKNGALDPTTRGDMVDVMINSLAKEFQDFKTVLTESQLLTKDGLTIGDNLAYSTADKWIGDFFTNDFLNSLGLNQMYDGDYAVGRKDFVDMVKRHKGSIGYGIDMGEGYTNIVTVEDPIKYVDKETFTSFSELNDEDKKSIIASEIAMYKESNPNATEDDVKKFIDSKVHEIKVGDAQSYVTVEHVIAQLKRLGRFGKKVSAIYDKILEGKNITYAEVKILEKARAALNSRKTVIFDGDVYYKLSEIPLSPSLVNTPGFEWHKNLLTSMKAPGANVDQMVFRSASKAAQKNVVKFSEDGNFDFTKSVNPVENKYKRLQVETPSGKEDITAGTQLINLIISEQNPDLIVNYRGQDVTVRDLQQIYYKLLEDVRDVSFKAASSFLVDVNGKKDPKKAAKKFAETVESSGGSELQIRYFSPDENGNPKYNWNIAPIIEKAEELFLAHFNKAYSVQKVEGSKVSLVSDVGVRINGESLKWGKKDDTGKVWSECLMPRYIAELFELKEGDAIPDEAAEMLGYRIPTQDKHSMVSLRVKGFLPNEYGSVIIVPKEVVLLSGADFDIDSLYISRYGVYRDANRKLTRYGTATTVEGKFDEFLEYNISKNKDLKTMVKDFKLSNALNIKARMEETGKKKAEVINEFYPLFFKSLGLPGTLEEFAEVTKGGTVDINKGSLDNKILDAQMSLFNNSHIQDTIAKTPATIDSLKTISKTVLAARTKAKTIVDSSSYNGFSVMGRFYAFVNNTEGKRNIGPTALTNVANAELTTQNIEYSYAPLIKNPSVDLVNSEIAELFKNDTYLYLYVNGKLVTGYSDTLDSNGNRKADSLSTVLSAMTDNAKEALANLVNLGYDIIPIVNHAITQGIDLESAILMVNTPDMITYGKAKKAAKRLGDNSVKIADMIPLVLKGTEGLDLTAEEKDLILNPPLIAQSRNLTTELLQNLISLNPKTTIVDKVIPRNEKIMYLTYRVLVLKALSTLDEQQKFIMNFTSLQSLYKGSNVSFEENERFVNAINTLGVYKFFKDEKIKALYARGGSLYRETTDTTKDTFDLTRLFKNNSSLVALAENFSRINGPISQEYFISRTPTFTRLTKTMYPAVSGAERYQIARQLLTFISTHVYKRAVANNPDNFMHKLMVDMGVSDSFGGLMKTKDGLTIGEELLDVKGNLKNRGQRNYLLDRLSIEEDNIGMVTIEFPSMSKFNNAESNKLTDAFLELYSDDSTREFSKKLFLYLFFKDNFKFRNNTFINNVADFMFSDYSKSLDTIQNELSKDAPNFSELGFASESQLFNTFADIFIPDYNNKDLLITIGSLKSLANGTLKDVLKFANVKYESGKTGVTLSVNKEALRKFLRDNKTLSKTVKYTITKLVQTKVDDAFSGIPGFISTEKEDVKSSDPSTRSNSRIVKSTYRLIADNEKEVVYAEMPQVGKKNLSPYAFTLKSLSNIAAMVQAKRDEAYTKRRIDSIFTPVSGQIADLELGANKILEDKVSEGTGIKFSEDQNTGYRERTIKNASADATIAIASDFESAGEKLTKSSVLNQNKLYLPVSTEIFKSKDMIEDMSNKIVEEISKLGKFSVTLNIAGNGIYTLKKSIPGGQQSVDNFTLQLLQNVVSKLKALNITVESLRTGGQTGFDEAGAKAGFKLGIPTTILAPKGWKFRNESGVDISNEALFKERFNTTERVATTEVETSLPESSPTMSETGILETSVMMPSFEQDIPGPESNNAPEFNPDNAPQGAAILDDDDIKPDETGTEACIK